jgi:hypothetical protein
MRIKATSEQRAPSETQPSQGAVSPELARKYLYCVIRCKKPQTFNVPGVVGPHFPIYTIHYRDLAAVVSDTAEKSYDSTRLNMTTHMRVLEEVMKEHTILPLKFNSISVSEKAVCDVLLKPAYDELLARLEKVAGRVEMGVKVFWREGVLYEEIVAENDDIRRLRDRIAGKNPDSMYKERIRLGELTEKALLAKRTRESEQMLARLRPYVEDVCIREPATERMALNVALLLQKSKQAAFEETLNTLDQEEGRRIMMKCIGPAPLYNFVQLTLN